MRRMRTIRLNELKNFINFEELFLKETKIDPNFYPEAFEEWKRINQKGNIKIDFDLDFVNQDDYYSEVEIDTADENISFLELGIINLNSLSENQLNSLYREFETKKRFKGIQVNEHIEITYLEKIHTTSRKNRRRMNHRNSNMYIENGLIHKKTASWKYKTSEDQNSKEKDIAPKNLRSKPRKKMRQSEWRKKFPKQLMSA